MDKHTLLKVYPRTHIKAVMVDENTNLEEFIGADFANRLSTLENSALDKETARTTYQPIGDYVTKEDSQNYTNTAIANLVDSAPETLNTLNELATAISEHLNVTNALDAAISNKADKILVVDHGTNDVVFSLTPNVYHKWGIVTNLSLTLTEAPEAEFNEYMFEFISGDTATTLSVPNTILWVNQPNILSNTTYQCSIVNNIGIFIAV